jgi:hypothetical protein
MTDLRTIVAAFEQQQLQEAALATAISRIKLVMMWETCYRMEQALHFTMAKTPWEYWLAAERLSHKYQAERLSHANHTV